jgi:diguanylate cyclase (GGDEF)-like protein
MTDTTLVDIIELCRQLDERAATVYGEFADLALGGELKAFWREMAVEEQAHAAFWSGIGQLARQGELSQMFEGPATTLADLREARGKIDRLLEQCPPTPEVASQFRLAYRMELYLLLPAFETIFHFLRGISELDSPAQSYEAHLERFIAALTRFGTVTPELEMLGETLSILWQRNRTLVLQGARDSLTGLLNRRGFFAMTQPILHFAARRKLSVGILLADIDGFRIINDRYGNQRGDDVLKAVADSIAANTRASDLVARYGGDEFIAFFCDVDTRTCQVIADKIRSRVAAQFIPPLLVTVSVGTASGQLGKTVDQDLAGLIAQADAHLAEARRQRQGPLAADTTFSPDQGA